jgi:hypothetical protein
VRLQDRDRFFEKRRLEGVVRIQWENQIGARVREAGIPRSAQPAIHRMPDHTQPRIVDLRDDGGDIPGDRCIVDDNRLPIVEGLRTQALERLSREVRLVVAGNDDRADRFHRADSPGARELGPMPNTPR